MAGRKAGFTMVELVAVLCILALVFALGYPRMDAALTRMRVRGAGNVVAGDLALLRMLAVRNGATAVMVLQPSPDCQVRFRGRRAGYRYRVQSRVRPSAPARDVDLRIMGGRVCLEMNGPDTLAVNSRGLPRGFNNRTLWLHERRFADTMFLSVMGRVRRTR